MLSVLFILALLFGLGFWVISIYNKAITFIEAVNNDKKQIDIQLDRRYKVFESLIEVVKKYMDYEKTTLKDVVALRNQAQAAAKDGDVHSQIDAENKISRIASNINLFFEQYPDLKASKNAMQLQEEIVNTENKLAFAKQAYNDAIERYNAFKKRFFESLIIGIFAEKLDKFYEYWGLAEEDIKDKEAYKVEL